MLGRLCRHARSPFLLIKTRIYAAFSGTIKAKIGGHNKPKAFYYEHLSDHCGFTRISSCIAYSEIILSNITYFDFPHPGCISSIFFSSNKITSRSPKTYLKVMYTPALGKCPLGLLLSKPFSILHLRRVL